MAWLFRKAAGGFGRRGRGHDFQELPHPSSGEEQCSAIPRKPESVVRLRGSVSEGPSVGVHPAEAGFPGWACLTKKGI